MASSSAAVAKVENAHGDGVWCVDWAGDRLLTGSCATHTRVKTWRRRAASVDPERALDGGHGLGVVAVSLSRGAPLAASGSLDGLIRIWDLSADAPPPQSQLQQQRPREIECEPGAAWGVRFSSPDGALLAATGQGGAVALWHAADGQRRGGAALQSTAKFATCTAFSGNGRLLACGALDGTVSLFDVASGRRLHALAAHSLPVRAVAFADDATLLAASDDGCVSVHDAERAELRASLSGHAGWVLALATAQANTRVFATGGADKTAKLWDLATKAHVRTFAEHTDMVWGVAFNTDATELATVSDDRSLIINSTK